MDRHITLIRHGMTAGNLRKAYIGITDEPLSIEGEGIIRKRVYPTADIVFSSPLKRCVETSGIIYPDHNPIIINELRETDFGEFEGKTYLDLSDNPHYQAWIDGGGIGTFPGGESREQADARALKGFQSILDQIDDSKDVSIVTHGGTIMAILSHYFGGDYYSYHVENGEGYSFDLSHDGLYSGLYFRSFLG